MFFDTWDVAKKSDVNHLEKEIDIHLNCISSLQTRLTEIEETLKAQENKNKFYGKNIDTLYKGLNKLAKDSNLTRVRKEVSPQDKDDPHDYVWVVSYYDDNIKDRHDAIVTVFDNEGTANCMAEDLRKIPMGNTSGIKPREISVDKCPIYHAYLATLS